VIYSWAYISSVEIIFGSNESNKPGLTRGTAAARLLGLRVRIPPANGCLVSCECCVGTEVSATGRSLVQRSHIECVCVIECDQVQQYLSTPTVGR
jgi:hypothetical protein